MLYKSDSKCNFHTCCVLPVTINPLWHNFRHRNVHTGNKMACMPLLLELSSSLLWPLIIKQTNTRGKKLTSQTNYVPFPLTMRPLLSLALLLCYTASIFIHFAIQLTVLSWSNVLGWLNSIFLVHSLLETYKNLDFLFSYIWNVYIYVWIITYA